MRISEAFCKMRLSEYCTSQDVDRAIAVTVDSFVGGQKVSCKKALARAFAKYVLLPAHSQGSVLIARIGTRLQSQVRKGVKIVGMALGQEPLLPLLWLSAGYAGGGFCKQ